MNTVVLITSSTKTPDSLISSQRLPIACLACASMPSGISPVDGTTGITPDVNTNPLASIACEYGPIAAGALSVEIIFKVIKANRA